MPAVNAAAYPRRMIVPALVAVGLATAAPTAGALRAEAIAETRRAIRFAKPDGVDARRVRRSAYYNLSLMGVALAVPDPGSCAPLERAPGCDRTVHGCTYSWSAFGTGGGESGTWLVVALEAAGATIDGAQDRVRERPAAPDPRYDDPSPQDPPTESAILILCSAKRS